MTNITPVEDEDEIATAYLKWNNAHDRMSFLFPFSSIFKTLGLIKISDTPWVKQIFGL